MITGPLGEGTSPYGEITGGEITSSPGETTSPYGEITVHLG